MISKKLETSFAIPEIPDLTNRLFLRVLIILKPAHYSSKILLWSLLRKVEESKNLKRLRTSWLSTISYTTQKEIKSRKTQTFIVEIKIIWNNNGHRRLKLKIHQKEPWTEVKQRENSYRKKITLHKITLHIQPVTRHWTNKTCLQSQRSWTWSKTISKKFRIKRKMAWVFISAILQLKIKSLLKIWPVNRLPLPKIKDVDTDFCLCIFF